MHSVLLCSRTVELPIEIFTMVYNKLTSSTMKYILLNVISDKNTFRNKHSRSYPTIWILNFQESQVEDVKILQEMWQSL